MLDGIRIGIQPSISDTTLPGAEKHCLALPKRHCHGTEDQSKHCSSVFLLILVSLERTWHRWTQFRHRNRTSSDSANPWSNINNSYQCHELREIKQKGRRRPETSTRRRFTENFGVERKMNSSFPFSRSSPKNWKFWASVSLFGGGRNISASARFPDLG